MTVKYRGLAVGTLGDCLKRPAMMSATPGLSAKIRMELFADLDDPDWNIRGAAMDGLRPFYKDREVQQKLNSMAQSDPYFTIEMPDSPGTNRYLLREFARRALNPSMQELYIVTRVSTNNLCRVQHTSEFLIGEPFIGPETAEFVKRIMCDHYDPTGQDPSLCWRITPANACAQ